MTIRAFNSIQGFSVGQNPSQDIILANGDITTVNFTANGVSTLGPIGNVKIDGGTSGQLIITDGLGNLSFSDIPSGNSAAPMPYYIEVGNSYIVPENFQGLYTQTITIDGTFEVDGILVQVTDSVNASNNQILYSDNGTPTGNTGFTFNSVTGNLAIPGNLLSTGDILPSVSNTYSLGSTSKRWSNLWLSGTTIYLGNSVITETGGNLTLINPDGGELNVTGNATYSDLSISGNVLTGGILTDHYYYANGQPLDFGGNPGGSNTQIQFNNNGEFGGSANLTFDFATNNLSVSGNITGETLISNNGCITLDTGIIAVSSGAAGIFASTITDINLGLDANIVMGDAAANVTVQGNLIANGNVSATNITGTLTTASQPNVTSVGTLSSLSVTGNINTGNITVTNTVDAVNVKVTDLFSKRTSINITAGTVIDTFPIASFRSAKYTMRAGDGVDYQALEVLLVHNNINSIITVYGSLSTSGTDLVAFTTDISGGNVNVYATAVGPNTNLNLMGTYVPD